MMQGKIFNTAIVGCGKIAGYGDQPTDKGPVSTHAQAYHRHPRFKLKAIVDDDPGRLKDFRKSWDVPRAYGFLDNLLKEETLDVISICTPSELHAAQIGKILTSNNKPKLIFVEKPVCLRRNDLDELRNLEKKSNVAVIVNFSRRFDPAHIKLRDFIQRAEIGKVIEGGCVYYGGWLNNGSHVVDTLRMLLNEEPVIQSVSRGAKGRDDDDCLDIKLLFKKAPILITGFDESHYQIFEMELRFEKGRVLIKDFGSDITIEKVKVNEMGERVLFRDPKGSLNGLDSTLYHAVNSVSDYIDHGTSKGIKSVFLSEAGKTMEILWQALRLAGDE